MKRLPFTPEMFRAWREGKKTVTRRLINPQPPEGYEYGGSVVGGCWSGKSNKGKHLFYTGQWPYPEEIIYTKPHYRPGERVVVVTRWAVGSEWDRRKPKELPHDFSKIEFWISSESQEKYNWLKGKWRPARFVPLHLEHHFPQTEIISARPERLQDITEEDAMKEGMIPIPGGVNYVWSSMPYKSEFATTWNRIHGPNAFSTNPLVWRIEIAPPGNDWRIG